MQYVLPCWFGVREQMVMDQGWCGGSVSYEIEEGRADGVDLSGRTVVILVHFPDPTMFDGNGTARLFIDEGANAEQVRELSGIFQGQEGGGGMEMLASLMSTWLPVEKTAIHVTRDGDGMNTSVGGVGQVVSKAIRDGEGMGFTMRGGGFIHAFGMEEAELAPTTGTKWSDPGMPRAFETKSGARGRVRMSG